MYHIFFFIPLLMVGCFHVLAIVNSVDMNIGCMCFFELWFSLSIFSFRPGFKGSGIDLAVGDDTLLTPKKLETRSILSKTFNLFYFILTTTIATKAFPAFHHWFLLCSFLFMGSMKELALRPSACSAHCSLTPSSSPAPSETARQCLPRG